MNNVHLLQTTSSRREVNRPTSGSSEHNDAVETLLNALPSSLATVLVSLAYCSSAGQATRLRSVGPGSRLVLQTLGAINSEQTELTPVGLAVANQLITESETVEASDSDDASLSVARLGVRSISRVVSTQVNLAAARTSDSAGAAMAEYAIVPDSESPSEATNRATVGVVRMGKVLRIWQKAALDDANVPNVFDAATMESLPRKGQQPLVVNNDDGEPPAALLRRILVLGPGASSEPS